MVKYNLDVRTIRKKIANWDKLFKYEEDYYWKKCRDKADYLAQKYPKLVAFNGKKKVKCLTCERMITIEEANGCHWIEKGTNWQYRCRRKERNIYCCCERCNAWEKERHHTVLTVHVTKLYWLEWVEDKIYKSFQLHKKPHYTEIEDVIEEYNKKIALIKKL